MKKFLTIALALVMVLALAAPAMAFTGVTEATAGLAPKLSIYLVDYTNSGFFGVVALPATDRGYAKNEIVASVVEVAVPNGYENDRLTQSDYTALELSGSNVSLAVSETTQVTSDWGTQPIGTQAVNANSDGKVIISVPAAGLKDDTTHKVLFFAKVTGDNAKLTATLKPFGANTGSISSTTSLQVTLGGVAYTIAKPASTTYTITAGAGYTAYPGAVVTLTVDSNNKSTGMVIDPDGSGTAYNPFPLGVTVGGVLGIAKDGGVATSGNDYTAVMAVYNDIAKGAFGLDYFKIGNYLYDSFFTGLTASKTVTASVDIKPWTAYVTVPDTVVVTPPKTGDAAGIMGFVMIVLAAAAAVVVKKVRA